MSGRKQESIVIDRTEFEEQPNQLSYLRGLSFDRQVNLIIVIFHRKTYFYLFIKNKEYEKKKNNNFIYDNISSAISLFSNINI